MDYKVSVIFITYNHGKYVEKALRSILEQETNFPFEVVVGDDMSTDDTRSIIENVAKTYPDRQVRFVKREKNTGRPTLNVYETTYECSGEYLAYLEGDDYWIGKDKLQKQVDFLENHKEYIAVTHSCKLIDEEDAEIVDEDLLKVGKMYDWSGPFTYNDFCYSGQWAGHYATVVSRNIYKNNVNNFDYSIIYKAHDFVDDAVILLFLLLQGDIYRMDEVMSAWRYVKKANGTNWNSLALQRDTARDDCYLSKTLMQWVEKTKGLTDYSVKRCKADFGLALRMYLTRPNKSNKQFLKDMYEYGITHVVMKDAKTSLFRYSLKTITNKILGKE